MSHLSQDSEKRRLLVIGIDGASYNLLDPMADRGLLPNLAVLMKRGFRAKLRSTIPPNSAAAWATFMTGKNPGHHGILRFQATRPSPNHRLEACATEFRPGAYTFVNSASITSRRIWDILGAAGKRVAVINVPMTYPPRPLNGIMITGLLTPPGAKDFTYPPELAESLDGYQIEQPLAAMGWGRAANRELVRSSYEILRRQGETALHLLGREQWDFFFVVFTGTDRLQHRLWHYFERIKDEGERMKAAQSSCLQSPSAKDEHAKRKEKRNSGSRVSRDDLNDADFFRENLDRYYGLLDSIVGRLVEAAGGQANCIILSDHGFGPAPRLAVYRRALARQLGLEAGEGKGGFHTARAWLERHGIMNGDRLRRYLAGTPLRRLLGRVSRLAARKEQEAWRSARAYLVVLHKYIGGIGINLAPSDPGYEPLRRSLMARLAGVLDPDSGSPLITNVWQREEIYHGARLEICPDVIFRLDERYGLAHGEAPGGRLVCPKTFRSQGIHRDEGVLILSGPDIEANTAGKVVSIEDVAATALYLLNTPIPEDMDGRAIAEAVAADYRERHPVRIEPAVKEPQPPSPTEARGYSAEDEEAIAERLRDLGYLD